MPTIPVILSLAGLQAQHTDLAVTLAAQGMGAAERRVRDGSGTLGLCALLPAIAQELQAVPLTQVKMVPVVARPPAVPETRAITRGILGEHVQLILTDPLQFPGRSFSVVSTLVRRFVDIALPGA